MNLTIELDQEEDGRWFAYIEALPGVIMYGPSKDEAITAVKTTALRVIADRIDHGELPADLAQVVFTFHEAAA